jgi:rsbT co-antagonist protein RsbR
METPQDVAATLAKFNILERDVALIREAGRRLEGRFDAFIAEWYQWLCGHAEFERYFGNDRARLERAQSMQRVHWQTFFSGMLDVEYFRSRRHVGAVHARIELPNDIFIAGMSEVRNQIARELGALQPRSDDLEDMIAAIGKLLALETFLAIDELTRIQREKLEEASQAIIEMSTPVTPIWEGMLLLPLVGIMDSIRARDVMNKTLAKIAETRSRVFVLDIGGVAAMDTAVANQIIKISKATRLMGCETIVSGISPAVARTLVELGVAVDDVRTTATLQDAITIGLRLIGADSTSAARALA